MLHLTVQSNSIFYLYRKTKINYVFIVGTLFLTSLIMNHFVVYLNPSLAKG